MNRPRITDEEISEAIREGVVLLEDEETSEMVSRMEREADEEIAATTVTLRWGKDQVDVIKRAAGIIGVPYQTYLKQVVFRQALEDIVRMEGVLGTRQRASGPASGSRAQAEALADTKTKVETDRPSSPRGGKN